MSDTVWAEISSLRARVEALEQKLPRTIGVSAHAPKVRIGTITAVSTDGSGNKVYTITERNVDALKTDEFAEVYPAPGDPGPQAGQTIAFSMDDAGKRYILPSGSRLICVRDEGAGNGKHVEIDKNGTISVPTGSETLSIVFAEPTTFFHSSTRPSKQNRIYPGIKITDTDGNKYYLCFLAGHGDGIYEFSDSASTAGASTISFAVTTDGQGNVTGISVTAS